VPGFTWLLKAISGYALLVLTMISILVIEIRAYEEYVSVFPRRIKSPTLYKKSNDVVGTVMKGLFPKERVHALLEKP
jgi:hypothetical protein